MGLTEGISSISMALGNELNIKSTAMIRCIRPSRYLSSSFYDDVELVLGPLRVIDAFCQHMVANLPKVAQVFKQVYKGSYIIDEETSTSVVLSTSHVYLVNYNDPHDMIIEKSMALEHVASLLNFDNKIELKSKLSKSFSFICMNSGVADELERVINLHVQIASSTTSQVPHTYVYIYIYILYALIHVSYIHMHIHMHLYIFSPKAIQTLRMVILDQ